MVCGAVQVAGKGYEVPYALPQDIAYRIYLHGMNVWYHGEPVIELTGNDGEFGYLTFNFIPYDKISLKIYIKPGCKEKILDSCYIAVYNFKEIVENISVLWRD